MISELIEKISRGYEISQAELKEAFDEIFTGLAQSSLASSFLTAVKIKNETPQDISSAISCAKNAISKINISKNYENLVEYFTLEDEKNFFDIQTALDIICSANNLGVLRYTFLSPFYTSTPFKTIKNLGINSAKQDDSIQDKFEQTNFAYLELSSQEPYFKYTNELKRQLNFENILNYTDKFLNPYNAKNQIIGVKNKELVEKIAQVCLDLNNSNSLILSSDEGLPFISTQNDTFVAEAWKNKIFTYNLNLELLGLKKHCLDDIKISSTEQNAELILKTFKYKEKDAIYDFIVANAALNLYICKKADSIISGIDLAKHTIDNNIAYEKLEQLIRIFS